MGGGNYFICQLGISDKVFLNCYLFRLYLIIIDCLMYSVSFIVFFLVFVLYVYVMFFKLLKLNSVDLYVSFEEIQYKFREKVIIFFFV